MDSYKSQFLVFDIETNAMPFDSLAESQQEYLLRGAKNEEEIDKKKREMALTPYTSQVVCIGLKLMALDEEDVFHELKTAAYALDSSIENEECNETTLADGRSCFLSNEQKLLSNFWGTLKKYRGAKLISFNGRNFDAPYLMLRSAVLRIKPAVNLMTGTKFDYPNHIDLLDKLTYYLPTSSGPTRRFNFDFFARAYGIASPKAEGIDGSKVGDFFAEGRIKEIAEYCLRDVDATWELFQIWNQFLNIPK